MESIKTKESIQLGGEDCNGVTTQFTRCDAQFFVMYLMYVFSGRDRHREIKNTTDYTHITTVTLVAVHR